MGNLTKISNKHQQLLQKLIRLPVGLKKIQNKETRSSGFKFFEKNVSAPMKGYKLIAPEGKEKNPDKFPDILKGDYINEECEGLFWVNGMFNEGSIHKEALKTNSTPEEIKNKLMPEILNYSSCVYDHVKEFANDLQICQKYHMEVSPEKVYSQSQFETLTKDLMFLLPQKKVLIVVTHKSSETAPTVGEGDITCFYLIEETALDKKKGTISMRARAMLFVDKLFCIIPAEFFQTREIESSDLVENPKFMDIGWFKENQVELLKKTGKEDGDGRQNVKEYLPDSMYYLRCVHIALQHRLIPEAIVETSGVEPGVIKENLVLKKDSDLRFEPKWKFTTIVLRNVNPERQDGPTVVGVSDKTKVGRAYHAVNMHPRWIKDKGYTMVRAHFRGDKSLGVVAHDYDVRIG
tara:strand:- start:44 stop:1261 length:1218 start_codon:yes stop_codon:yes gene_type:complete